MRDACFFFLTGRAKEHKIRISELKNTQIDHGTGSDGSQKSPVDLVSDQKYPCGIEATGNEAGTTKFYANGCLHPFTYENRSRRGPSARHGY